MTRCWRGARSTAIPWPGSASAGGRRTRRTATRSTTISEFAPVYAHALQLIPAGRVLDVGSCFGFLPLLLAERPGNTVTASDLSGGTMCLLTAVAAARGLHVSTLVCDAARIPVPDRLGRHGQHHPPAGAREPRPRHRRAREALRVARHQVVVAVPVEENPPPPTAMSAPLTCASSVSWAPRRPSPFGARIPRRLAGARRRIGQAGIPCSGRGQVHDRSWWPCRPPRRGWSRRACA